MALIVIFGAGIDGLPMVFEMRKRARRLDRSRNVNWFAQGRWVHLAKVAFERYFLRKMRKATSELMYEKLVLHSLGIRKPKDDA